MLKRSYSSIIFLVGGILVKSDPAFFCEHKDKSEFERSGDFNFYKTCGDKCACSVYELLCLVR